MTVVLLKGPNSTRKRSWKPQEPRDAQLTGLKERGMLSDEESESKKRELLAAHPSR
ncbi:MAG: hypothetical protein WB368_12405 [Candidatus Sulfotelmatobacter sp.]|jgi:hypothetical protein